MREYPFIKLELDSGKILIGQSNGHADEKTPSGDVTVSTAGVMTASSAMKKVLEMF